MTNWKPVAVLLTVTAMTTALAVRTLWPKVVTEKSVPQIVTRHDTVRSLPEWYEDSVRYWKKRKYTTDTLNLTFTETIVDTQYIPVNSPPERRPNIWPMLTYRGSGKFGDTAIVSTFGLRTGNLAISKVFIPGMIVGIDASDSLQTPRLDFAPFPKGEKHGFWHNPKVFGIGFGTCAAIGLAASIAH